MENFALTVTVNILVITSKFRTVATHKQYLALNVEYVHNHIPIEFYNL